MVTCCSVAALSRAAKKISEPPSGDHAGARAGRADEESRGGISRAQGALGEA